MDNPEIILTKITICLTILFGIYFFLLRKETTFRFIRFYLLISLAISVALPFLPTKIHWTPPAIITNNIKQFEPSVRNNNNADSARNLDEVKNQQKPEQAGKTPWLLYLYFAGITFFSVRFLLNSLTLAYKIHHRKISSQDGFVYIDTSPGKSIHSFFYFIFLPKEQFNKPVNSIIEHEKIHARQFHSIDVLLIEMVQVMLWFHPLIYLFKNAIALNHEYLADKNVVKKGKTEYQKSLLEYCIENSQLQFTSGFNFNHVKKRLSMMTKQSKKQNTIIKPLLSFIMAGLLFIGLSLKEKPANAVYADFETQVITVAPALNELEPLEFAYSEKQDPIVKEKENELMKLKYKRDSLLKSTQLKVEKARKLAEYKHKEELKKAKASYEKEVKKAQKEIEVKRKESILKMKKVQQEMEGKEITPEMES